MYLNICCFLVVKTPSRIQDEPFEREKPHGVKPQNGDEPARRA